MDVIQVAVKTVQKAVNILAVEFSTLIKAKMDEKQDKVAGKGLSTEDYTTAEKTKLSGIETGAEVNTINVITANGNAVPVANKTAALTLPTKVSDLTNDSNFQDEQQVEDKIDAKVSSAYKAGGSATMATLPALTAAKLGVVVNMSEDFTTTSDFLEGAGKTYPAGTNVVVAEASANFYKYDVLAGFVDLSGYVEDTRKIGNVPLSADIPVTLTGDTAITVTNTGTASAIGYSVTHKDSGVTAGSKGDMTNQTPAFGGTFKVLSATVDAKGHVTALGDHTARIPDTEATVSAKGLMSVTDKAKLDKHVPKGSATRGIYIDASDNTQTMTHELNADVPSGFAPATAVPLMDGTATVGTSAKYAREDHVHPPDISRASAADLTALVNYIKSMDVYRNASGNPVTFGDGSASPVRNLAVTLTPTQSGSGDPSPDNVRPISGTSSVSVTRSGKNLLNVFAFGSTITAPAGTITVNSDASITVNRTHEAPGAGIQTGIPLKTVAPSLVPGNTYTFSGTGYSTNYIHLQGSGTSWYYGTALTITQNHLNATVNFYNSSENPITISQLQIEAGSESTAYEPYQGASVNIPLVDSNNNPLTVYGGTLDVTTGELTVTWAKASVTKYFAKSSTAATSEATNLLFYRISDSNWPDYRYIGAGAARSEQKCNIAKIANPYTATEVANYGNYIAIMMSADGSSEPKKPEMRISKAVVDAMSNDTDTVEITYPIVTPVTYQLTPQQLATLYGYNTVSTDAGTLSVTYRADPGLALGGG